MTDKAHKDRHKEAFDEYDEVIQIDNNLLKKSKHLHTFRVGWWYIVVLESKGKAIFLLNKSANLQFKIKERKKF